MAIYKYTMIKYMKSWSTWIILAVSLFISAFIGGYLPFQFLNVNNENAAVIYATLLIGVAGGITSFLSLFVSIFAGFKAAQMFKDEVEDGTFLVVLSKPISRGKIILMKWFALQSVMVVFTLLTAAGFMISASIFDKADGIVGLKQWGIDSLRSKIWVVGGILFGILTLFGLIFSSISLLLSTRVTTGATIGISIAIGVIIPITGMISLFTRKPEYENINLTYIHALNQVGEKLVHFDQSELPPEYQNSPIIKGFEDQLQIYSSTIDDFYKFSTEDEMGLYGAGLSTGDKDGFKSTWIADLNYHVGELASFASEAMIPAIAKEAIRDLPDAQARNVSRGSQIVKTDELGLKTNDYDNQLYHMFNATNSKINSMADAQWDIMRTLSTPTPSINSTPLEKIAGDKVLFKFSKGFMKVANRYVGFNDEELEQSGDIQLLNSFNGDRNDLRSTYSFSSKALAKIYESINNFITDPLAAKYTSGGKTHYAIHPSGQDDTHPVLPTDQTHIFPLRANPLNNFSKLRDTVKHDFVNVIWGDSKTADHPLDYMGEMFETMSASIRSASLVSPNMVLVSEMSDSMRRFIEPFTYIIFNQVAIKKFMDSHKTLSTSNDSIEKGRDLGLVGSDSTIYQDLSSIQKDMPEYLVKAKSKPYVNRNGLLFTYLAIALILVPISYLVIRRQDYR